MSKRHEVSRSIIIFSEINQQVADEVVTRIMDINAIDYMYEQQFKDYTPEPIEIFINSGGGTVTDGFAIIGAMEMSETPIITYGMGLVASMALIIFASGDFRFVHRFARLMNHSISYGMMGHITDHEAMREEADLLQRMAESVLLDRTGFTRENLAEIRLQKRDFFFSGKEAVRLGVADELIKREERILDKVKDERKIEKEEVVKVEVVKEKSVDKEHKKVNKK